MADRSESPKGTTKGRRESTHYSIPEKKERYFDISGCPALNDTVAVEAVTVKHRDCLFQQLSLWSN